MNSEQKNNLFEEHIVEIENEFLQAVPEMRHRLGEMEKPADNQYAIFEIPMNDVIPNMNLTIAYKFGVRKQKKWVQSISKYRVYYHAQSYCYVCRQGKIAASHITREE